LDANFALTLVNKHTKPVERRHHKLLERKFNNINYVRHTISLFINKATCFDLSVVHLQASIADYVIGAVCTLESQYVYINKIHKIWQVSLLRRNDICNTHLSG